MHKVSQNQLVSIWKALNATPRPSNFYRARSILLEALKAGWFYSHRLEDIIYESDRRLDDLRHEIDVKELSETLGYHWANVSPRPRMRSTSVIYRSALPVAGLAALLMDLEALGFQFDPEPLIAKLRPALLKQDVLTDDELGVFWSPKSRGKSEISLAVEREPNDRSFGGFDEGKFANGYRYFVMFDESKRAVSLTVKGPQHRRRGRPVETVCHECGYTWWRGDPDSSAYHRREHKKRMETLDPQPHELMQAATRSENDPELVTSVSPKWKHSEIYSRALAFKREEKYDFVQWQSSDGDNDPHVHGFLFTNDGGVIVGAAAFRLREPDAPYAPHWGLQWVWIAPPFRRQGILASRWPMLRERFGDFVVEGPVSEAMYAFLERRGEKALLKWPENRGTLTEADPA